MLAQNFEKYRVSDNDDGETNVSFYKTDCFTYGYEEDREYVCQYTYDKYSKTTAIVLKSKIEEEVEKKSVNLTPLIANSDRNINMNIYDDKLSGWTLIIEQPNKEIPEICKAIQSCVAKMR